MSGTGNPHAPPPEVPEEFADAYRAAYEEAMTSAAAAVSHRVVEPEPAGPTPVDRAKELVAEWRQQRWFVPALVGVVALVLILGAYGVGRVVSADDPGDSSAGPASATQVYTGDTSHQSAGEPAVTDGGKAWRGAVSPVVIGRGRATCTAPPGVDSSDQPVSYDVTNAFDGQVSTAWRCDGSALGVRLVFRLPGPTMVGQVGLVPGYAKTDPKSHADRYAENNRITEVRWTIGDIKVDQVLSGDPKDRSMQLLRIPRTEASRVTLDIVQVTPGPRNTTAISEVRVAAAD